MVQGPVVGIFWDPLIERDWDSYRLPWGPDPNRQGVELRPEMLQTLPQEAREGAKVEGKFGGWPGQIAGRGGGYHLAKPSYSIMDIMAHCKKWSNFKKAKSIGSCSLFNSTCWLLGISKAKSKTFPDVLMLGVDRNQQKTWRSQQWCAGSRSLNMLYVVLSSIVYILVVGIVSFVSSFSPSNLMPQQKADITGLIPPQQSRKQHLERFSPLASDFLFVKIPPRSLT